MWIPSHSYIYLPNQTREVQRKKLSHQNFPAEFFCNSCLFVCLFCKNIVPKPCIRQGPLGAYVALYDGKHARIGNEASKYIKSNKVQQEEKSAPLRSRCIEFIWNKGITNINLPGVFKEIDSFFPLLRKKFLLIAIPFLCK